MPLTNKVAIVTGSGQGIGEGIARKLASIGAKVAILDLESQTEKSETVAQLIRDSGGEAIAVAVDVSDRDQVFAAFERVKNEWGDLHIVVNNAGIAQVKPLVEVTPDDLTNIQNVNVASVLWGIQAATAQFETLGHGGAIINASSIAGYKGFAMLGAYSSTKFAVKALTQVAAQELAPKGITVNAYCPGIVGTSMWEYIDAEMSRYNGLPSGQTMKQYAGGIALGRTETPADVAELVAFLAGPGAAYITGQSIITDGGMIFS